MFDLSFTLQLLLFNFGAHITCLFFYYNRTPFTPQLKILKRPEKTSEERRLAEQKKGLGSQQPVRTLAQREAAYAEARQRIMGVENHSSDSTPPKSNDVDSR